MVPGNHPSRVMTAEAPLGSPPLWAAAGAPYGGCSPGKRGPPRGNLGRTARRPLLRMSHCQRSTDSTFLFSAESVFQFSRLFRGKSPAASGPAFPWSPGRSGCTRKIKGWQGAPSPRGGGRRAGRSWPRPAESGRLSARIPFQGRPEVGSPMVDGRSGERRQRAEFLTCRPHDGHSLQPPVFKKKVLCEGARFVHG